jgi:aspartyl-tRNA(Asn)/glutamyl-tRNA(Gln) amidotransferase subunit C
MAKLMRKEVEEIALLARLHLEPAEIEQMQEELGAILTHFRSIAVADTNDVLPMTHAVPTDAPLRDDVVAPSLPTAEALRAVPRREGDLIVVPAIISGQGDE